MIKSMRDYEPKVSIIIPLKEINNYLRESISHILNLDYENFEILIFPDAMVPESEWSGWCQGSVRHRSRPRIIPTARIGPAEKRNLALKYARGELMAFLDDDAYPRGDWLRSVIKHFKKPEIAAVGGPAVTPDDDSFWQKVSGAVFLSRFSGGNPERYWPVGEVREIDDWPSVNLLVRKSDFAEVGGFNAEFWPGEDTILCRDLNRKLNKKIIYDPAVLAFHHRRSGLLKHLQQIGSYGLHRGFFAKKYPENSLKLKYFLPSVFLVFALSGWVLLVLPLFFKLTYLTLWLVYLAALFASVLSIQNKIKDLKVSLATLPYIFLTHLYYGLKFLQGLASKTLKRKLRK